MIEFLNQIDTQLFLFLNGMHHPVMDEIMWVISAKLPWIPFYLLLGYFFVKRLGKQGWFYILAVALAAGAADYTSVHWFKFVFERLRPSQNPALESAIHLVNNYHGGKYGFVSSHAANTFALAVFTGLTYKTRIVWVGMLLWAFVVSYSRIYLGVHYPGDILGGALLGSIWAVLFYMLLQKSFSLRKKKQEQS